MAELQECITDDFWKQSLQSEIITALTESGQTQNHALEQVGYYYQCCAPAFLYKYYRDQPLNLNSVMSNKMWYSAPRNFNDAFDCDITIDEQAIFNNLLPAISGGKTIRKGSPAWIQLKSNLHKQITLLENTFADQKSSMGITCLSEVPDSLLMWSHYANSYAGICIEYDFNQIKDVIGFIYPVEYTTERPTLSLQDLGVAGFNLGSEASVRSCEPNMGAILSYLLAKNVCWNYEKEWRIINVGEENTPLFIDLPFVKSITFGMNMDPICKQLLWDVCKEKGIECFEIEIGTENYELRRKYLSKKDFTYDIDLELNYIDILTKQISAASERIGKMGENIENEIENKNFSNVSPMLSDTLDMLSNSYYLKISLNRICEHETEELSSTGMPNEILNNISLVDTFVSQAKEMCVALKENMPIFLLGGLIKGHEYTIINKQLGDIHELVGKFENIEWNSFCIKIVSEDTENNSEYSEVDDVVKISE